MYQSIIQKKIIHIKKDKKRFLKRK